jgi:hypothetical protein
MMEGVKLIKINCKYTCKCHNVSAPLYNYYMLMKKRKNSVLTAKLTSTIWTAVVSIPVPAREITLKIQKPRS